MNDFLEYLKEKYKPVEAIILHGSRSSGYATENSDWDFIILTKHKVNQKNYRSNINNAEIEFEVFQIPIKDQDILKTFGSKLKHAKVVYDQKSDAEKIIAAAKKEYTKGIALSYITGTGLKSRKSALQSAVNGMKDNIDNPAMFTKKLGSFYPRIISMWYWFKLRSYSDNIYISIPLIKEKDPKFSEELEKVYSFDTKPKEKVAASEKLIKMIFG